MDELIQLHYAVNIVDLALIREGVSAGKFEPVLKYKLRIYESKTGRGSGEGYESS